MGSGPFFNTSLIAEDSQFCHLKGCIQMAKFRIPVWLVRAIWVAGIIGFLAISVVPIGRNPFPGIEAGDKIAHLGVFFILALFPVVTGVASKRAVIVVLSIVAVGSELLQSLLPYRSWEVIDITADLLGLFAGLAAGYALTRMRDTTVRR